MARKNSRSLKLSAEGIAKANIALKKFASKTALALAVGSQRSKGKSGKSVTGMSRGTVGNFLKGEPVQGKEFHELCKALGLKPEEVQDFSTSDGHAHSNTATVNHADKIDALVQNIRDAMRPTILEKCGKMKMLDMEQHIGLDDIYTNAKILEKMTRHRETDLIKMMKEASPEEVERFSFGAVKDKPISGLEAVERYNKLMIFGKPGAGKTTFLKYLAVQCIGGKFQPHRIPVFVELKEFAETEGHPNLTDYIHRIIPTYIEAPLNDVFDAGRVLILLDALDEVNETDLLRVLGQIKQLTEQPHKNQYVITCRIAAIECNFDHITDVELADFGIDEIEHFSKKFFKSENDEVNSEKFLQKLKENPTIKELAKSPLLLAMLCYLFKENGELTENRADLYERGIDIFLKKWDKRKLGIKRRQIHENLSIEQKKNILSHIAWKSFEAGNYFFKQRDLENQVRQFAENEFQSNTNAQNPDVDYEDVLDSFESHHGLLIKRAQKIYSFSYLSFHEYFTAREIKKKSLFHNLAKYIFEKRWRQVIILTIEMLSNADELICYLKEETDAFADTLLAGDQKLRQFLEWTYQKAQSLKPNCKLSVLQAYYLWNALVLDSNRFLSELGLLDLDNDIAPVINFDTIFQLACSLDPKQNRKTLSDLDLDCKLTDGLVQLLDFHRTHYPLSLGRNFCLENDIPFALSNAENLNLSKDFVEILKGFLTDLQNINQNYQEGLLGLCRADSQSLAERLRALMIQYRNIGHDWHFTIDQLNKLEKYLIPKQLLVDCLNSDCAITHSIREEIEDTLLLPIAEIEKRKSEKKEQKQ
jgi:predicted NACHT family NTPase